MLDKDKIVEEIRSEAEMCFECKTNEDDPLVFARGNPNSRFMIVGEGPGEQEERQGRPFVGAAGHLLDRTFKALGLDTEKDFFVTNIVFYRSYRTTTDAKKENKPPSAGQIEACRPFLERLIGAVNPLLIVALGAKSAQWFLGGDFKLTEGRGRVYEWRGIKILPTFHPAAVLRAFGAGAQERRLQFEKDLAKAGSLVREFPSDKRLSV